MLDYTLCLTLSCACADAFLLINVWQVVFKTLPGPRISRVELGGTPGAVTDKVFFAAGTEVQGYQKKGKSFLRFDTNLTEDIQSMLGCSDHMT